MASQIAIYKPEFNELFPEGKKFLCEGMVFTEASVKAALEGDYSVAAPPGVALISPTMEPKWLTVAIKDKDAAFKKTPSWPVHACRGWYDYFDYYGAFCCQFAEVVKTTDGKSEIEIF